MPLWQRTSSTHMVREFEMYKEERDVLEMRKIDEWVRVRVKV